MIHLGDRRAHRQRVQARWIASGADTKVGEAAGELEQLDEPIAGVEACEATIRTGWLWY